MGNYDFKIEKFIVLGGGGGVDYFFFFCGGGGGGGSWDPFPCAPSLDETLTECMFV